MKDKINAKFFKLYHRVEKRMSELGLLLFKIQCFINIDELNKNIELFVKKELETFKMINELKTFCVINQIPFDCDKYIKLDLEDDKWLKQIY